MQIKAIIQSFQKHLRMLKTIGKREKSSVVSPSHIVKCIKSLNQISKAKKQIDNPGKICK